MSVEAHSLRSALSPAQVDQFYRVGFVTLRRVFGPNELGPIRRAFDRLRGDAERLALDTEHSPAEAGAPAMVMHRGSQFVMDAAPHRIRRVVWCGASEPVLALIGADPRLLGPVSQLLGSRKMDHLINQAHFKSPGDGVAFPWHQDSTHRRYGTPQWRDLNGRGSYVQTVIAVDEVTRDNGPLSFIPGSCTRGHLDLPGDGSLPPEYDPATAVRPELQPGDVVLFGPYTIHGSEPNESTRPRRALINGYAYPGANSRTYPGEGSGRSLSVGI
ncbi:hypothetical protein ABI59_07085 [Acidobacteria bacterium Mor1]|nr:hypothetical protein ABI59_07085 [Acidobacteria bacterium Mor1]